MIFGNLGRRLRARVRRPTVYEGLAITLATAGLGGVALAAIPNSNGVITGCYQTVTSPNTLIGALRVINKEGGQTCTALEKPLSWNFMGPKGDTGATGPTGPPGPAGVSGYEQKAAEATLGADGTATGVATCPAGKKVLGGGWFAANQFFKAETPETVDAGPEGDNAYRVFSRAHSPETRIIVTAICASVGP